MEQVVDERPERRRRLPLGHRHVRNLLVNRALVGENEFADQDVDGRPVRRRVKARWPALVDVQLFRAVEAEVERRSASPRNKKRKARGWYPLRPVCAHCGAEYNGSILSKAQNEERIYSHRVPNRRADPGAFARYHAGGCKAFSVGADELESAIRNLILAERASADFEEEIRAFVLEHEGFRTAAEQLVEEARRSTAREIEARQDAPRRRAGERRGAGRGGFPA